VRSRARVLIAGTLVAISGLLLVVAAVVATRDRKASPLPAQLAGALRRATPARAPFAGMTAARLAVGGRCLHLVIADTTAERERGLMERTDLGPYDGMLFVSPKPVSDAFTMSDTRVALDIAWFDAAGRRVDHTTMVPCPRDVAHCPLYRPRAPWRLALETLRDRLPGGNLTPCT
jgi:uncharacterized protein